ncbi:MAG: GNAT family N-acetyltransferase [Chloroflexota bacterium]
MTASLKIAPVKREDLDVLYQVFAAASSDRSDSETNGFFLSQYSVEGFWAFLAERTAYAAWQANALVGYVVIARPTPDQMDPIRWFDEPLRDEGDGRLLWLKMVAVLPRYKRQGVATALYRHLFQTHAKVDFITGLYEYPLNNRASAALHLALGFQRVGIIERETDETDETDERRVTGIFYKPSWKSDK